MRMFIRVCLWCVFQNEMRIDAATHGQEIVAAVLIAEARGEGEKGMAAVAEFIRRRADIRGQHALGG